MSTLQINYLEPDDVFLGSYGRLDGISPPPLNAEYLFPRGCSCSCELRKPAKLTPLHWPNRELRTREISSLFALYSNHKRDVSSSNSYSVGFAFNQGHTNSTGS